MPLNKIQKRLELKINLELGKEELIVVNERDGICRNNPANIDYRRRTKKSRIKFSWLALSNFSSFPGA